METALFLGLTSGGACLASCGPLAAALLASQRISLKWSSVLLAAFLFGRLLGYLGWAVVAWALGQAVLENRAGLIVFGAADFILGAWLIYYGASRGTGHPQGFCPGSILRNWDSPTGGGQVLLQSGIWGFLSGLQVCAPFLVAVVGAAQTGSLGGSVLFFLLFYLGTGIWFIPFPFFGTLGRFHQVAQVARFLTIPLGAYFIYSGFISIAGGNPFYG